DPRTVIQGDIGSVASINRTLQYNFRVSGGGNWAMNQHGDAIKADRRADGVADAIGEVPGLNGQDRLPAERHLFLSALSTLVELLARHIGVANDKAGPAAIGKHRHGDVDGDNDAEEAQHHEEHVAAGKFLRFIHLRLASGLMKVARYSARSSPSISSTMK